MTIEIEEEIIHVNKQGEEKVKQQSQMKNNQIAVDQRPETANEQQFIYQYDIVALVDTEYQNQQGDAIYEMVEETYNYNNNFQKNQQNLQKVEIYFYSYGKKFCSYKHETCGTQAYLNCDGLVSCESKNCKNFLLLDAILFISSFTIDCKLSQFQKPLNDSIKINTESRIVQLIKYCIGQDRSSKFMKKQFQQTLVFAIEEQLKKRNIPVRNRIDTPLTSTEKSEEIEMLEIFYACNKEPQCVTNVDLPFKHGSCGKIAYINFNGIISCQSHSCKRYSANQAIFSCHDRQVKERTKDGNSNQYEIIEDIVFYAQFIEDCLEYDYHNDIQKDNFRFKSSAAMLKLFTNIS